MQAVCIALAQALREDGKTALTMLSDSPKHTRPYPAMPVFLAETSKIFAEESVIQSVISPDKKFSRFLGGCN